MPTLMLVDARGQLEQKWWSIPDLPIAVTLYTNRYRVAVDRAREFNIDVVVVCPPVTGLALDDFVRVMRSCNPGIRMVVLYDPSAPPPEDEIGRAAPDFVSANTIDPALVSAVVSKMLQRALVAGDVPRDSAKARRSPGARRLRLVDNTFDWGGHGGPRRTR